MALAVAWNSVSPISDKIIDTFEKEENGMWVSIAVVGMSEGLWGKILDLNNLSPDNEVLKKIIER